MAAPMPCETERSSGRASCPKKIFLLQSIRIRIRIQYLFFFFNKQLPNFAFPVLFRISRTGWLIAIIWLAIWLTHCVITTPRELCWMRQSSFIISDVRAGIFLNTLMNWLENCWIGHIGFVKVHVTGRWRRGLAILIYIFLMDSTNVYLSYTLTS